MAADARITAAQSRRRGLFATTSLIALAMAGATPARGVEWNGAISSDWFDAGNWAGGVPVGDEVEIDSGTVVIGSSITSINRLFVGRSGASTLTIQNGGRLTSEATYIGDGPGSTGSVTVDGAGSTWNYPSTFVYVGVDGAATLTIRNGGTVSGQISYVGGAAGSVMVDGAGSTWNNSGLFIGTGNTGTLTIQNGGKVNSVLSWIGEISGGTGSATVDGAGSTWSNSGNLIVGHLATGTLTIRNGGTVSVGTMDIAHQAGSRGTLNIGAASGQAAAAPGALAVSSVRFGAGTGNIVFNHTATNYTFAPIISGPGSVSVEAGTTILSGRNTYTGPTTVKGGTLTIASSGTVASATTVSGGGTVVVNGASGAVTANTGGTVVVNGTSGAVAVNTGGTVGGSGTLGPTTINGGTLSPGNSIGTITVAGNLVLAAASTYLIEVDAAGQADRTNVAGTAALGGTVKVVAAPGSYAPYRTYTILNAAGGISGGFSGASANFAFLTPSLAYDANNVFLTLVQTVALASAAQTPNQVGTAAAVQALGTRDPIYGAVVTLATGDQARQAFGALSGEAHASTAGVMLDESRYLRDAVSGRARQSYGAHAAPLAAVGTAGPAVAYVEETQQAFARLGHAAGKPALNSPAAPMPNERVLAVWSQAIGAWGNAHGDGNAASLDRNAAGFITGVDATFANSWRLGLAGGYTRSSIDVDDRRSSTTTDNLHGALYVGAQRGPWGLHGGAAFTRHEIDTNRTIAFPGFFDSVTASYNAYTTQAFGEIGYGVLLGTAALEPFAAAAYVKLDTDRFREGDGAAALTSGDQTLETIFTTLGLRAATVLGFANGGAVTVRGTLAWRHALGDVTPEISLAFASGGTPFTIAGAPLARNSALVGTGLDLDVTAALKLGIAYSGQFADNAQDHAVKGNLLWRF